MADRVKEISERTNYDGMRIRNLVEVNVDDIKLLSGLDALLYSAWKLRDLYPLRR